MDRFASCNKVILPGKASQKIQKMCPPPSEDTFRNQLGRDYASSYLKREEEMYKKESRITNNEPKDETRSHRTMSELESVTVCSSQVTTDSEAFVKTCTKYSSVERKKNTKLFIHEERDNILRAIEARRIVIIRGATGCGKTTQVPQFILDYHREKAENCKIIVTQPRRLAAVTVAKRVCKELGCDPGTLVGYQIGQERQANDDTRILYVTTGVLLQKLIKQKDMKEFTHYIIDEIHERDQEMDFLLIVVRKLLNTKAKNTKLIVMSATMDVSIFTEYLHTYHNEKKFFPLVVDIKERTQYAVQEYYLDDLVCGRSTIIEAKSLIVADPECPGIPPNAYKAAARLILAIDKLEAQEATSNNPNEVKKHAVLVFLPGLYEIESMEKMLKEISTEEQRAALWIKPLHSSITADEQNEVFRSPPKASMRKVILSTNIAESSITVTDIKYVVDFCLTKNLVTDLATNCTSLELAWASKNSLIQRAGRVGRVSDGRVYKMITRSFYQNLEQQSVPEILRCPLENLVLKAKLLEMGSPKQILALALDQPDLGNINQAVANLKEIGALILYVEDGYDPSDGDLTKLGKIVANLPMDIRLGKLIYLGNVFGVLEESVVMACAMATKNMFSTPYGKYLEAYNSKLWWADSSCSDCTAFLNAYKAWRKLEGEGNLRGRLSNWARDSFLQPNVLRELAILENDVKNRLKNEEVYSFNKSSDRTIGNEADRPFFLKLAIAAAFYPNYFVRGCQGTQIDEKTAINTLGGHDPFSTVYLQGLPLNQETVIYKNTIGKLFENVSNRVEVNVDNGSKAYVTFRRSLASEQRGEIPGKIEMAVYRAIKMRQAGVKFVIPRLKPEEASKVYAEYLRRNRTAVQDTNTELQKRIQNLVWPWRKDNQQNNELLEVKVCYVETPQRFWILDPGRNSIVLLKEITEELNVEENRCHLIKMPEDADLPIGAIYVSSYSESAMEQFYRCRIISKKRTKDKYFVKYSYTIYFIDFGNSLSDVIASDIYDVDSELKEKLFLDKLPDFAVECSLAKIKPASKKHRNKGMSESNWGREACSLMESIEGVPTIAKVYSVVNDVLRVKLLQFQHKNEEYRFESTVNHLLIEKGIAEKATEDYLSLLSREERKRMKKVNENAYNRLESEYNYYDELNNEEDRKKQIQVRDNTNLQSRDGHANYTFDDVELTVDPDNRSETFLKGPFSPLEMKLSGVTQSSVAKQVRIERNSVNSILLDTDPSDPKERMMVSAFVGTNPSRDILNLKYTTMMPNLPGLPMFCCLVFSPMVELRCNATATKFSGALCGLGYERRSRKAYYPENDVEIVFDVEIDEEDLVLINKIRYWLNVAVDPYRIRNVDSKQELEDSRSNLQKYLKQLFMPENKTYELQSLYFTQNAFRWGLIEYDKLRDPCYSDRDNDDEMRHPADDFLNVYRLIWSIWLHGDKEREKKALLKNLEQLREYSEGRMSLTYIECNLCREQLTNQAIAKLHLKTTIHQARLKRYRADMDDTKSVRSMESGSH